MSDSKNKTNEGSRGANVVRTKAKPKVNPVSGANFDFTPDPRLGESFVVVLGDPSMGQTMTVHHPIGITNLDDDDWVCSPTADILSLLLRKEDPTEAARRSNRDKHRLKQAITAGLLVEKADSDGDVLYRDTDVSRQATLSLARSKLKDAYAKGAKKGPDAYLPFIESETIRKKEAALRAFLAHSSVISKAEIAFPSSGYLTKAGPLADRVQKSVGYLEGLSRAQAVDAMIKRICGLDDE